MNNKKEIVKYEYSKSYYSHFTLEKQWLYRFIYIFDLNFLIKNNINDPKEIYKFLQRFNSILL